jgi:hypothetical protein
MWHDKHHSEKSPRAVGTALQCTMQAYCKENVGAWGGVVMRYKGTGCFDQKKHHHNNSSLISSSSSRSFDTQDTQSSLALIHPLSTPFTTTKQSKWFPLPFLLVPLRPSSASPMPSSGSAQPSLPVLRATSSTTMPTTSISSMRLSSLPLSLPFGSHQLLFPSLAPTSSITSP